MEEINHITDIERYHTRNMSRRVLLRIANVNGMECRRNKLKYTVYEEKIPPIWHRKFLRMSPMAASGNIGPDNDRLHPTVNGRMVSFFFMISVACHFSSTA